MKVIAVIPAAGIGTRMGADRPKQYLPFLGQTVLEHTLENILSVSCIERVYVATSPEDNYFSTLSCSLSPKIVRVEGGLSRAESVIHSLDVALASWPEDTLVLVHDAARPGVTEHIVLQLLDQAARDSKNGAIAALRATDTLKQVHEQHIQSTLNRELVWNALTPQVFLLGELHRNLVGALNAGFDVTDEASAMEWAGAQPTVIEATAQLRKVTTHEDMIMLEALLKSMKNE